MVLTAFSLLCLLVDAAQVIQVSYSVNPVAFWTIRGLINILTMTSVAALAFLFRNPFHPNKSSHDQNSRNLGAAIGPVTPREKDLS